MVDLPHPWPAYAAAFVEILTPVGRLEIRPLQQKGFLLTAPDPWIALASSLGVGPEAFVWIVTAADPHPLELDATENELRAAALEAELDARGLQHLEALARSPDGRSREVSRAILGTTRVEVLEVAAGFDQLAVFEIGRELACVETATGEVITSHPYEVGLLGA
jgi:hypothetical protein